jgi:Mn2+/Fe2+ NRAMP family transporter
MTKRTQISEFWSKIGPGILFAAAAIGVSHLIQSTRAGAIYAWLLIPVVIIANIIKWPLFEAGPRYAFHTGKSLLHAYRKISKWAIPVISIVTLGSMVIVTATVGMVTAGLFQQVGLSSIPEDVILAAILALSVGVLWSGKSKNLEKIIRPIMIVLVISTIIAVILGLSKPLADWSSATFSVLNPIDFTFLIALIGWMPAPLDISIWYSQWAANKKSTGNNYPSTDFRIGYGGTTVMAVIFVLLGAIFLFGKGELPNSAVAFAGSLEGAYAEAFGSWSILVVIAALTCMFSTTLAVVDAYPRVCLELLGEKFTSSERLYRALLIILALSGWFLATLFSGKMISLVQFATILAFLSAPVIAWLNLRALKLLPQENQPTKAFFYLGYFGVIALIVFSVIYIFTV